MEHIAIVMPCFNDYPSVRVLLDNLPHESAHFTVYVVDDCSSEIDTGIVSERVRIISLNRNVGHQSAISIGLSYIYDNDIPCDKIVIMDSDGEDNPALIPQLAQAMDASGDDVVVASRKQRHESLFFRFFYRVFKKVFRMFTGDSLNWGNFMVINRKALKRLVHMNETGIHLAASILLSKLRFAKLPLDRATRYRGTSRMNFSALVNHGFKSILLFARVLQSRLIFACVAVLMLGVLGAVLAFLLKLFDMASAGWLTTVAGFSLIILFQMAQFAFLTLFMINVNADNIYKSNRPVDSYRKFIDEVL